jgi:predicted  nucleic acid-binding Zn-ribbon protein
MKRIYYIFFLAMILSCNSNNETISENKIIIDSLQFQLNSKDKELNSLEFDKLNNDSIVNQYALYIQRIKNNINEINNQESIINNAKSKEELYKTDTTNIINAIKIMSEKLIENESMISELNNAVKLEKNKNSQFASKVTDLSSEIAKSNREIYFLREELNSLNSSFEAIFNKYNEQNKKISFLNNKLNEIAYVIGTKSELLDNGVLTKGGGLIGLGKSRKLNSDFNTNYFTFSSKQDLKSIVLGYKSVKLMTPHPSESYKISKNINELIDSLLIVNVENFWKNSKFLVLEVK